MLGQGGSRDARVSDLSARVARSGWSVEAVGWRRKGRSVRGRRRVIGRRPPRVVLRRGARVGESLRGR